MIPPAYQHDAEFNWLLDLMRKKLLSGPVIEIGTLHGGTALQFAQVFNAKVITVDLPMGEFGGHSHGYTWEKANERSAALKQLNRKICPVLGNSQDPKVEARVVNLLGDQLADVLFIDGDHSFAGVSADFDRYEKHVRTGGIVAFHDINNTALHISNGCFVHEFWAYLKTRYGTDEMSIGHEWGGIGVVWL